MQDPMFEIGCIVKWTLHPSPCLQGWTVKVRWSNGGFMNSIQLDLSKETLHMDITANFCCFVSEMKR